VPVVQQAVLDQDINDLQQESLGGFPSKEELSDCTIRHPNAGFTGKVVKFPGKLGQA
jgi:hypothetical protein